MVAAVHVKGLVTRPFNHLPLLMYCLITPMAYGSHVPVEKYSNIKLPQI